MKHLFSSGEILYSQNVKKLEQGILKADTIQYGEVSEGVTYEVEGNIDERPVLVRFKIKEECYPELKFKATLKILMQSDLMDAEWEDYEIENI